MSESFLFISFIVGIYAVYFAILIAAYVLRALGLYKMAKNTQLPNPWLAWIPIGDTYIMGHLSKMSPYMKNKFPKMHIIYPSVAGGFTVILLIYFFVNIFSALSLSPLGYSPLNFGLSFLMAGIVMLLSLFIKVLTAFVLYHIYKAYDSNNAVLYLILSIVISLGFIFLFVIRNRQPVKTGEALTE